MAVRSVEIAEKGIQLGNTLIREEKQGKVELAGNTELSDLTKSISRELSRLFNVRVKRL